VSSGSPSGTTRSRLRVAPNLFGIAFGLAGLAGCWRVASRLLPLSHWVADIMFVAAGIAWVVVLTAWVAQMVRGPRTLAAELHDAVVGPFISLLPIDGMLLSVALVGVAPEAGRLLFGLFAACTLLLGGWLTGQWISDRIEFDALHPGYFLPTVAGGLVAAQGAATVGWGGPSQALFGIGMFCWVLLGSVLLARLIVRPPLPAALSPTLAIEVAPPAVAANAYLALNGGQFDFLVWILTGYTVLMVLVQLRLLSLYSRAPFGPAFWSFTFSFASVATLALHWIDHQRGAAASVWAWMALGLITLLIGGIAVWSVTALAAGRFLPRDEARAAK